MYVYVYVYIGCISYSTPDARRLKKDSCACRGVTVAHDKIGASRTHASLGVATTTKFNTIIANNNKNNSASSFYQIVQ